MFFFPCSARSLARSPSPFLRRFPSFHPPVCARGKRSRALPTLVCSLYSPLFIAAPPSPFHPLSSRPPSFSAPFVKPAAVDRLPFYSLCFCFVFTSLFSRSPFPRQRPPCVFPDNATEPGQGCVFCICDAIFIRPQQTRAPCRTAPRRVVDARVAWLLKFPHDVTTFRGIRSVKKLLQPAALLCGRDRQNAQLFRALISPSLTPCRRRCCRV